MSKMSELDSDRQQIERLTDVVRPPTFAETARAGGAADFQKPIRVTVFDPETGEQLESRIVANDYVLITAGNRYVKHVQQMGRTHVISVAVEKPLPAATTDYAASTKGAA